MVNLMLYPPYIEGKLPAQVGDLLKIPYQLNRAVGEADLKGKIIHARIKTASTSTLECEIYAPFVANSHQDVYTAEFKIEPETAFNPTIGQYYKIQLGFSESVESGVIYYSTVGVFKYTEEPTISMPGLSETDSVSLVQKVLQGKYKNGDLNEKVDSYKFDIFHESNLIETSGWLVHNRNLDTESGSSMDSYEILSDLTDGRYYDVQYSIITNNGLEQSSPLHTIHHVDIIKLKFNSLEFWVKSDNDEGIAAIGVRTEEAENLIGEFELLRRADVGGWKVLKTLVLDKTIAPNRDYFLFKDYTVESDIQYEYALRQIDSRLNLSSSLYPIGAAKVSLNSIFLYDGTRQLKVTFNPKITSFKTTLLETKVDTIGGKYPKFFRNGQVGYKEFPISGLISYHDDKNGEFFYGNHVQLEEPERGGEETKNSQFTISTNLTGDNFVLERNFKLQVLDWLNNGKVKLFRSAAEGNYLIRLMNSSLSPEDRLGRMLHTFNATAYEVAECSLQNLKNFNIVSAEKEVSIERLQIGSINFDQSKEEYEVPSAKRIQMYIPVGETVDFYYSDGSTKQIIMPRSLLYQFDTEVPIVKIKCSTYEDKYFIHYFYMQEEFPLFKEEEQITSIKLSENIEEISGDGETNLIEEKKIYSISYLEISGEEELSYKINNTEYTLGSGRIVYTKNDNINFESLILSKGLKANIYYLKVEINPNEEA